MRAAIDALIDFDRVRACTDVEIFISATNVWTGKITIFRKHELTADHLMASACIPTVFQAVEIDGVPYWDGGYMGNPALYPLYYESMTDDILLVQINPLERRQTPRSVRETHNRLNEITFNGTLLRELRAVAFVQRLIKDGKLSPKEYKDVHLHRIDGSRRARQVPGIVATHHGMGFLLEASRRRASDRASLACGELRRDRSARDGRSRECSELLDEPVVELLIDVAYPRLPDEMGQPTRGT